MATFSLGNSAVVPEAPGVYINERPGALGTAAITSFNTCYMLVETENSVPTTRFPFNRPIAISSVSDYQALLGNKVPDSRIPTLSYNCVQEFYANAQVGDLRVVRVGTPSQLVELEIFPSGNKINSTSTPSSLQAGDRVYVQVLLNDIPLVPGDRSAGYTADGEWLGVPVIIPVNYVAGDTVNNRKISAAIADAVAKAIEDNPTVRSSVYVRDFGMLNDLDPKKYANSQNAFVTLAATTFGGNVSVVTQQQPVGANFVFMQNTYEVQNIAGEQNTDRVPQDYIQCIRTAFDGQQDQGYLITPTAYAQFDAIGRAAIGAAAADHCENNNYKWMALADPGPFLVTDLNKYKEYAPHRAAEDLQTNQLYLVDNAIYRWVGATARFPRLTYQELVFGVSPRRAVIQSTNLVAPGAKVGILDSGNYVGNVVDGALGKVLLDNTNAWPGDLKIQAVTLSGAEDPSNPFHALDGNVVYLVAPPFNLEENAGYSLNNVYLTLKPADAASVLSQVTLAGGTSKMTVLPSGAVALGAGSGACKLSYPDPFWDLPVDINGQSSDLIENLTDAQLGVNTLHLPATLQSATTNYRLSFQSRTIYDPSVTLSKSTDSKYAGAAVISCLSHGLVDGQKVFFTRPIMAGGLAVFQATTKTANFAYYVKAVSPDAFVLSPSVTALSAGTYVLYPNAAIDKKPTIFYSNVLGGSETAINLTELTSVPFMRGRKYGLASGTIDNIACDSSQAPAISATAPKVSMYLNNSTQVLGKSQIAPWGETTQAGWLPKLELVDPGDETSQVGNYYCVPTATQSYASESYIVPAIEAILGGTYSAAGSGTGPISAASVVTGGSGGTVDQDFQNVTLTTKTGTGSGATATITVAGGAVTNVSITNGGSNYKVGDEFEVDPTAIGDCTGFVGSVTQITSSTEAVLGDVTPYVTAAGFANGDKATKVQQGRDSLIGVYFNVVGDGVAPDSRTVVKNGQRLAAVSDGETTSWLVIQPDNIGEDDNIIAAGQPCYGCPIEVSFQGEETPPTNLWRFNAITSTNLFDEALRGVGFNGVPQAVFVEAGVDNVTRLLEDSQRYENPYGFIAYYGPYIQNAAGRWIPPSPYVTGVALRRYRAEGYQFPPAGVKYVLADAQGAQIPINSAQQNLLNPRGCNAVRTLPGYPQTSVYIWGGRTRINEKDAQQRLYQFVNTRVILNVVYGSLRNAFDNQIFNVIDGFGVVFNQIINVGNSVLNELYVKGALFGNRPSDAFQVICDERINSSVSLESGIVSAKVFVTPVPTLERIQIDLIRVAIGNMQKELDLQGLGQSNAV